MRPTDRPRADNLVRHCRSPVGPSLALSVLLLSPCISHGQALGARVEVATPVPTTSAGAQNAGPINFDGDILYAAYSDFAGERVASIDASGGTVTELGASRGPLPTECTASVCLIERRIEFPGDEYQLLRVTPDGASIDTTPLLSRSTSAVPFVSWRFTSAGSGFLLFTSYYDPGTMTSTQTVRTISATGSAPVGPERPYVGPAFSDLACTATRCGLLRAESTDTRLAFVDLDGTPLAVPEITLGARPGGPAIVRAAGAEFRVVTDWYYEVAVDGTVRSATSSGASLRFVLGMDCLPSGGCIMMGGDGTLVWEAGTLAFPRLDSAISVQSISCGTTHCAIAGDVAATRTAHVVSFRIVAGSTTDETEHVIGTIASPQLGPVGVAGNVALFHRWVDRHYQLLSVALTDGVPVGPPSVVARDLPEAAVLRGTCTAGDEVAVVFATSAMSPSLVRFDRSGVPLVPTAYVAAPQSAPIAIAWNGLHYLVAWIDPSTFPSQLYVQRYDAIGQRVDETPRLVRTGGARLAVVEDPTTSGWVLIVDSSSGIRATSVGSDGVPAATDIVVRDAPTTDLAVSRVSSGTLIAWREVGVMPEGEVRTAVLSSSGTVSPLGGRPLFSGFASGLVMGGTSGRTLVWVGQPDAISPQDLRVLPLDPMGAADGAEEIVHVADFSLRLPYGLTSSIGAGPTTILYAAVDPPTGPTPAYGSVWVRTFADGSPAGDACIVASDCTSGVCSAGVCCDRACDGTCEACSTGVCTPRPAGTECRAAVGMCDVPETCDGTASTCPSPMTTECDASIDVGALADASALPDAGADSGGALDGGAGGGGAGGCSAGPRNRTAPWAALLLGAVSLLRRSRPRTREHVGHERP